MLKTKLFFSPECVGEGRREVLIQRQVLRYQLELEPVDSWVRAVWVRACNWIGVQAA